MAITEERLEKMKEFSEYIRFMRESVQWTNAKLAKYTGVEKSSMNHYERQFLYPRNVDELRKRIQRAVAAEHLRKRGEANEGKTLH